ncbi:YhjD/YihY/BrkB family envelope integrity protein [Treponema sp. R80B11-R83G3]
MKQIFLDKHGKKFFSHLSLSGKTLLQRLVITLQLFGENSLGNHASACAYGFLLSAAPVLMLLSFILFSAFHSLIGGANNARGEAVLTQLVSNVPFLNGVLDETWLAKELSSIAESGMRLRGIAGLVSAIGIFWAGRIFILSLQRGLKVIFTGTQKRNPIVELLIVLIVELSVIIGAILMIFFSATARKIYEFFSLFTDTAFFSKIQSFINIWGVSFFLLFFIFYFVCRFIIANGPSRISAFWGSLCFAFSYTVFSRIMTMFLNQTKYNFLYGALGSLIFLLVNVFFFFMFFFSCAQLTKVLDSFDALLFLRFRQARMNVDRPGFEHLLFLSEKGKLQKYLHTYPKNAVIFFKGDEGNDIFYLLEGEVNIFVSDENSGEKPATLQQGAFFGEMGHLLSENRTATAKAKTAVTAFVLPPPLFDEMLKYDISMDRTLMELMSQRLKTRNEQFDALVKQ